MRPYWFKPKRFWYCFAAYYPVTKEGWAITVACLAALVFVLGTATAEGFTGDSLVKTVAGVIIIMLLFDIISFRTGEYPAWWRKFHETHKD